jgi:hypothetical protein
LKTRLVFTFFVLFSLLACSSGPQSEVSKFKDVTTDHGFGRGFYSLNGDIVERYLCPANVVNLNRVNCNGGVQRLYLWGVRDYLRTVFGSKLTMFENEVVEYLIKVDGLDKQIGLLLDVEPDHKVDLLPKIKDLLDQISVVESVITDLKNQQVLIVDQLRQQEDPDLRATYDRLEQTKIKKSQEKDQLIRKRMTLLDQYYAENAEILTIETFKRLVNQRALAVRNYSFAQENLKLQLDEILAFHTTMNFLQDSSTWDFIFADRDKTAEVVNSMGGLFNYYYSDNANRVIDSKWSDDLKYQILENPMIGSRLKQINLLNDEGDCAYHIVSDRFNVTTSFNGSATVDRHPPELAPLFKELIDGKWIIHETCGLSGMHARPFRIYYK